MSRTRESKHLQVWGWPRRQRLSRAWEIWVQQGAEEWIGFVPVCWTGRWFWRLGIEREVEGDEIRKAIEYQVGRASMLGKNVSLICHEWGRELAQEGSESTEVMVAAERQALRRKQSRGLQSLSIQVQRMDDFTGCKFSFATTQLCALDKYRNKGCGFVTIKCNLQK